jgi:hypothetical protein
LQLQLYVQQQLNDHWLAYLVIVQVPSKIENRRFSIFR